MADSKESIDVEIFGQTYKVKGDSDSKHIEDLADFVDRKMREIVESTSTVDTLKVAILASLNIADEYLRLKKEYDVLRRELKKKVEKYQDTLDEIIKAKV
jgi:cell division protein ZapA